MTTESIPPTREGYELIRKTFEDSISRHEDNIEHAEKLLDGKAGSYGLEEHQQLLDDALAVYIEDRTNAIEELRKVVLDIDNYLTFGTLPPVLKGNPCACGCGQDVPLGTRGQKRLYVDVNHRKNAFYRRRKKAKEE